MTNKFNIILELVTIVFGAYCLAAAANTILAPVTLPTAQTAAPVNSTPRSIPPFGAFNTILTRNLFHVFDPSTVKPPPPPPPPPQKLTDISIAQLNSRLLGTIYSNTPELRRAIVAEGGPQRIVKTGDTVQGLKIVEIQRRAIVLDKAGKKELLLIDKNDAAVAEQAKDHHKISRKWIRAQFKNLAQITREIHLKPADYGNGNVGVLVQNLDRKSQLNSLGLRVGDLILKANGKQVTQYRNPLEAFKLLETGKLTLQILRFGKTKNLTYNLVD